VTTAVLFDGVAGRIAGVFSSTMSAGTGPDPAPYAQAARRIGVDPRDVTSASPARARRGDLVAATRIATRP
jgi:hypothetical protein